MHPSDLFIHPVDRRMTAFWRILFQFLTFASLLIVLQLTLPDNLPRLLQHAVPLVAFTASVWIGGRFFDNRNFLDFGLVLDRQWWNELWLGVGIGFVAMGSIFVLFWAFGWLEFTGWGWDRAGLNPFPIALMLYMAHMAMVGFYEELFSRGYHLKNMMEGYRFGKDISGNRAAVLSLLTSSVIFGLMHAGNPGFKWSALVGITIAGLLLGIPYLMTGRLGYAIGLHFSWNFVQGGLFGFPVSGNPFRESLIQHRVTGPEWLTGGGFGPEAGLLPHVILVLAGILSIVLLVRMGVAAKVHPSFLRSE
jgi:membrane protease YdiL (CAAX protease family)